MSSVIFNFEYICTRINAAMIHLSVIYVSILQNIVRKKHPYSVCLRSQVLLQLQCDN